VSNVSLTIGGRTFSVSCADGEEAHVANLGRLIDAKVTSAGVTGQAESRMLLFAALLLADDAHGAAVTPALASEPALPPGLSNRLGEIAGRMENLASLLEGLAANA